MPTTHPSAAEASDVDIDVRHAEALLKTGALQSAIFNSANFSSIATDAKGVIQIFNVGAERMLGYTAAAVINTITPADISDPQEVVARATALSHQFAVPIAPGFEALAFKASRGIEDIYELTYVRKDGSRFPAVVSITALRDAQDAIIGYLLIGTDNTARKQVEEERQKLDQRLRDQHFYTRSLIESNIDALITTDPRGIITDVNKQTEALTGCTRDELIGAPFRNYFTDADRAEAGITRVLNEGTVTNYQLTARARNGKETVVSYNATTFHDRDRRLQGVFAAARDMTELKRFELTLQQNNVALAKASHMKSEFLASMSHELRTPLNAMLGFAQVLELDSLTAEQMDSVKHILRGGRHLLGLINEVLDVARIEAGALTLSPEPVAVTDIVHHAVDLICPLAAQRKITIDVEVPPNTYVLADRQRLNQILFNLLSNAVKYNREGGTVRVFSPSAEPGRISIVVADTGLGVSPEQLTSLFMPFERLGADQSGIEGTGLGLALAKGLTETMNGSLTVVSVVDQGSNFRLDLPAGEPARITEASVVTGHSGASQGPRTVLYIEDNVSNLHLMQRVVQHRPGVELLHAADGHSGLSVLRERHPDLVFLDLHLPDVPGEEVLRQIVAEPSTCDISVVVLTADATPGQKKRLLAGGAVAYLTKPFDITEVLQVLDRELRAAEVDK